MRSSSPESYSRSAASAVPRIRTPSSGSQALTGHNTAPISHDQARNRFIWRSNNGVPARLTLNLRRISLRGNIVGRFGSLTDISNISTRSLFSAVQKVMHSLYTSSSFLVADDVGRSRCSDLELGLRGCWMADKHRKPQMLPSKTATQISKKGVSSIILALSRTRGREGIHKSRLFVFRAFES